MAGRDNGIIEEINRRLEDYKARRYNVPGASRLDVKPPFLRPIIKLVQLDLSSGAEDVYENHGKHFLHASAINKFKNAAGIEVVDPRDVQRLQPSVGKDALKRVWVRRQGLDGGIVYESAEKLIDVETRSQEIIDRWAARVMKTAREEGKRLSDGEVSRKAERMARPEVVALRKFRHERAETGAMVRAVCKLLGLKMAYTLEELQKPFVVLKLIPDLDPNDREARALLMRQALNIEAEMYPTGAGIPPVLDAQESDVSASLEVSVKPPVTREDFEALPRVEQEEVLKQALGAKGLDFAEEEIRSMGGAALERYYRSLTGSAVKC